MSSRIISLKRTRQSEIVFVCFGFVFLMNAQQTQPQQNFSILIQALSIIHTAIAVFWHSERVGGGWRGRWREKRGIEIKRREWGWCFLGKAAWNMYVFPASCPVCLSCPLHSLLSLFLSTSFLLHFIRLLPFTSSRPFSPLPFPFPFTSCFQVLLPPRY